MEGLLCRRWSSVCVCVCVHVYTLCSRFLWRLPLASRSVFHYRTMVSFSLVCVLLEPGVRVCVLEKAGMWVCPGEGCLAEHWLSMPLLSLFSRRETVRSHASQTHTHAECQTGVTDRYLSSPFNTNHMSDSQCFPPLIWWCSMFPVLKDHTRVFWHVLSHSLQITCTFWMYFFYHCKYPLPSIHFRWKSRTRFS